jgi:hypothetical protein
MNMASSGNAVLVDLADYRRRREVSTAGESAVKTVAPVVWYPIWVLRPVWYTPALS